MMYGHEQLHLYHILSLTPCGLSMHVVQNGNYADHKGLVITWLHHHLVEIFACHHSLHSNL
jgi:hypothetical protein